MYSKLMNIYNTNTEYLNKDESNAIKGILILLIIAGHTHYLVPQLSPTFFYLYRFHVVCFFILPFFYSHKSSLSWNKIKDLAIKLYVPYLIFFVVCTTLYGISLKNFSWFSVTGSTQAFIIGSEELLKQESGFKFLWFIPAFFSFTMLKSLFDNACEILNPSANKKHLVFIASFLSIIALIGVICWFFPNQWKSFRLNYEQYVPFGMLTALRFFTLGIFTFLIIRFIPYIKYLGAIIFVILSIMYFINEGQIGINNDAFKTILPLIFPVCAFCLLLAGKKLWTYIPFMSELGKLSFPIYLVHVIVYNILEQIISYSILNAGVIYVSTIVISVFISLIITKINILQKLILPKGYNDFKSLFIK